MPRRRINKQTIQNASVIWLDSNINEKNEDCHNTINQLRRVVNTINTFTDTDQCIQFIKNIVDKKTSLIISGSLGQHIVPHVHNLSQVDSIFIFCANRKRHEQWAKEWPKIKGIFTQILPICEALTPAYHQCERHIPSISFVATKNDVSSKKFSQLDPLFMYIQIMKEILLLTIKFDKHYINEFINNNRELDILKQFKRKYHDETSIWYDTCECFLYLQLTKTMGGLISFNNFLYTSKNPNVLLNLVAILLIMNIDSS